MSRQFGSNRSVSVGSPIWFGFKSFLRSKEMAKTEIRLIVRSAYRLFKDGKTSDEIASELRVSNKFVHDSVKYYCDYLKKRHSFNKLIG